MPRILIRELDQTQPGSVLESNFTVVVPGQVADGKGTDGFDDNGVCECKSIKNFNDYIGKRKALTSGGEGIAAILADIKSEGTDAIYNRTISADEFYRTFSGKLYTAEKIEVVSEQKAGRLKAQMSEEGKVGEIWYKFTKIDSTAAWSSTTKYSVIEPGNEGVDSNKITQMGNQIAYELIRLGYTVLFKKFDQISELVNDNFWDCLYDKSIYDFRYIISGLISDSENNTCLTIYQKIASLADGTDKLNVGTMGRGDCVALLDIPENIYSGKVGTSAVNAIYEYAQGLSSAYCAWFVPTIEYDSLFDKTVSTDAEGTVRYENSKFPASFDYLACTVRSILRYPEWFAISGYNRGTSDLTITGVSLKLGEKAINKLQPRKDKVAVNVITTEKDNKYMWGNRTAHKIGTELVASDFLNIRQLCTTLKKQIYTTCRSLMFDPNSDLLWLNFCNSIRPTLEQMKAQQGIKDYKFEQKETTLKGKLFAAVRIIPIEAVEDFEIAVSMEDNFDETTITIDEKLTASVED